MSISLRAKGIGETGMLAIGWGGLTMTDAQVKRKQNHARVAIHHAQIAHALRRMFDTI